MLALARVLLYTSSLVGVDESPRLRIADCNFGEVYAFNQADCEIQVTNTGEAAIHIKAATPVTPRDSISPAEIAVPPKATVYLHAKINTGNSIAQTRHRFDLTTDEPGHERRVASARGFVLSALDEVAPRIDFGVVDQSRDQAKKTIQLGSREAKNFRITKILDQPAYLDVSLGPDGQTLNASVKRDAAWGMQHGFIKLAINTPNQPEVWVTTSANVHGEVIVAPNPVDLGLLRFGNNNESLLRVTSKADKEFRIGDIVLDGIRGKAEVLPCVPELAGCRLIRLTISDEQAPGAIRGGLSVDLPDFHQKMRIDALGLILAPDVPVHEIGPSKDGSTSDTNADWQPKVSSDIARAPDLGTALQSATHNDDSPPPGHGPLLKWAIANGSQIHGFQIFRSLDETGPFMAVNKATIKSEAAENESVSYQYRDNTAEPGKTYWYYIGIVFNDGHKQQLTGAQKVVAK